MNDDPRRTPMRWHPFAEKFPLLTGDEWVAFKQSIEKTGGNSVPVVYRMVDGERQGIDGRNRECACLELGLPCRAEEASIADADVIDFILARNVHRRHMTPELRRELVVELRAAGKSLRQIGSDLGVGKSTVESDLKAGVQNRTPEPQTVIGRDGKTYPARKTPDVVCGTCQRHGRVDDCPVCKEIRDGVPQREPGDDSRDGDDEMPTPYAPDPHTPTSPSAVAETAPESPATLPATEGVSGRVIGLPSEPRGETAVSRRGEDKKPSPQTPAPKLPKLGSVVYDKSQWETVFGPLMRQVDVMGNAYGVKDTPEADGIRRLLGEANREFMKLLKSAKASHGKKEAADARSYTSRGQE